MKRSTDRMLTTHTGSLPRSPELIDALVRREQGARVDGFDALVSRNVADVVRRQRAVGLDIVNDGEASKLMYAGYITQRLDGFGGSGRLPVPADLADYPDYARRAFPGATTNLPACIGPVRRRDVVDVEKDIANLRAAVEGAVATEAFMTAASPGNVAQLMENQHYATHEEYVWALAEAMAPEYEAIHAAGFLLQVDCPELSGGQHWMPNYAGVVQTHVEALNEATRNIAPESMRIHICWGNYEGPHHHDAPLAEVIGLILGTRPAAILFEGANPRHEHEWRVFKDVKLPEGKLLVPGVIDSRTNYIEHPQVVCDRIVRYANLVGRENVIAGVDCGLASSATSQMIDHEIAWAKLGVLSDGAALATAELFG